MKEFELKAIIPDTFTEGFYTVYLFNGKDKILLPFKTDKWGSINILGAKVEHEFDRPATHNTFYRTILALGGKVEFALIYKVIGETFYTYLRIKQESEILDIDSKPTDAIALALRAEKPVLVIEEVYEEAGIKVTRELLERSLSF